jgi:hypothetical protein
MALLPPRPLRVKGLFRESVVKLTLAGVLVGPFLALGAWQRQDDPLLSWVLIAMMAAVGLTMLAVIARDTLRVVACGRASDEVELEVVGSTTIVEGERITSVLSPHCRDPRSGRELHDSGSPLFVTHGGVPFVLALRSKGGHLVIVNAAYPYEFSVEDLARIRARIEAASS